MHFTKSTAQSRARVAVGNQPGRGDLLALVTRNSPTYSQLHITNQALFKGKVKGELERMFQVPSFLSPYGSCEALLAAEAGTSCQASLSVQHLWSSSVAWPSAFRTGVATTKKTRWN